MPSFLSNVNIAKLRRAFQKHFKDNGYDFDQFSELWSLLDKRVQQARYEQF